MICGACWCFFGDFFLVLALLVHKNAGFLLVATLTSLSSLFFHTTNAIRYHMFTESEYIVILTLQIDEVIDQIH